MMESASADAKFRQSLDAVRAVVVYFLSGDRGKLQQSNVPAGSSEHDRCHRLPQSRTGQLDASRA